MHTIFHHINNRLNSFSHLNNKIKNTHAIQEVADVYQKKLIKIYKKTKKKNYGTNNERLFVISISNNNKQKNDLKKKNIKEMEAPPHALCAHVT